MTSEWKERRGEISVSLSGRASQSRGEPSEGEGVSGASVLNSSIAGYVAGSCGVILGHPFDSVKVWMQTNTVGKNKHMPKSSNASAMNAPSAESAGQVLTTSKQAVRRGMESASRYLSPTKMKSTLRAVYSGIGPPLVTVGAIQSINFAAYDTVRRMLHKRDYPEASSKDYLENDSLLNCGIAGFAAGTGLAVLTSPFFIVKCQQQVTGDSFKQSISEALYGTNGRFSLRRSFIGFAPHFFCEAAGRAVYYTVYEGCKRSFSDYNARQGNEEAISLTQRMISGAMAGMLCWAAIFPSDTLRSRIYLQEGPRILSTTQMASQIIKEGVAFKGFWLNVIRAGPVAAAVLPVYDLLLEKLS
eukprot:scaffold22560_cov135-Cylindrotheca_fusiformis.AAC.69